MGLRVVSIGSGVCVQWQALVLVVMKFRVVLPEVSYLIH
jgi:hypothetical protein